MGLVSRDASDSAGRELPETRDHFIDRGFVSGNFIRMRPLGSSVESGRVRHGVLHGGVRRRRNLVRRTVLLHNLVDVGLLPREANRIDAEVAEVGLQTSGVSRSGSTEMAASSPSTHRLRACGRRSESFDKVVGRRVRTERVAEEDQQNPLRCDASENG